MSRSIEVETFDVLESVSNVKSIAALANLFTTTLARYGMTNFLITNLPPKTTSFEPNMIYCAWPDPWRNAYFENSYWKSDPVASRVLKSTSAFFWSEVQAEGAARTVMNEAGLFGLREGFTIPMSAPGGAVSCVSMAGPRCLLPNRGPQALQLIATYTHMRALELQPVQWKTACDQRGELTVREKECLRWVAQGKTDWEISTILSISQDTARQHVTSATRKLGCVNRTQAVANAIKLGEINI